MANSPLIRRGKVANRRRCIDCNKEFSTINKATTRCYLCLKVRRAQFEAQKPGGTYPPRPCLMCGQPYISSAIRVLCCPQCTQRRTSEPDFEERYQKRAKDRREVNMHNNTQLIFAYADLYQKQQGACLICEHLSNQQLVLYPSDRQPVALLCQNCATGAAALAFDRQRVERLLSLLEM